MDRTKHILVLLILTYFLAGSHLYAQERLHTKKPVKPPSSKTDKKEAQEEKSSEFQLGVGAVGSVLYLSRNVKEDNDALGYAFNGIYSNKSTVRVSAQYTKYVPIDIDPTWYDVKANTVETNVELIVLFKNNKTVLYPLVGVSYNTFKGYFTGMSDFLNLRELYKPNTTVTNKWFGVNAGTGVEHAFGHLVIFVDYKMRVGQADKRTGNKGINVMDVCYSGGIRVRFHAPSVHLKLHKLWRGTHDKYHWF